MIFFTEFVEDSPKDVDFRVGLIPNIAANQPTPGVELKKRANEDSEMTEQKIKKSKSEKIDM